MPWSEWIQSPLESWPSAPQAAVATGSRGYNVQPYPGNMAEQIDAAMADARSGASDVSSQRISVRNTHKDVSAQRLFSRSETDPDYVESTASLKQEVFWNTIAGQDNRPTLPREMWDMEWGVDYTVRPGRVEDDPDAYIEYEDGGMVVVAGDIRGWDGDVTLTVRTADHDLAEPITAKARAYLPSTTGGYAFPFPTVDEMENLPGSIWPDIGSGATFATVVGGVGVTGSGAFHLPAGTTEFCWVVEPSFDTFGYSDRMWEATVDIDYAITVDVLFPRWRYWRPGSPPLRQRQRDDGLALGGPRWRGRPRSRQASNRWAGYL